MGAKSRRTPSLEGAEQFTAVLRQVLASVSVSDHERFIATISRTDSELETAMWGRGPSPAVRRSAAVENLRSEFVARRSLLGECLTCAEVADLSAISASGVLRRLKSRALVGLKEHGVWRLPSWQFDAGVRGGVLPGLAGLQQVFPGGPVTLSAWANHPSVDLDGATPAAELAARHVDRVVLAARSLTAAAS